MKFTKEQEIYFHEILGVLNDCNALSDVILVGSWAEYIYEKESVIEGFESNAKTMDLDFLLNEDIRRSSAQNIVKSANKVGFSYKEDYLTGVSKFFKDDFEVEFLASQNGDGRKPVPKSKLGINAQQLTHIGFIKDNCISVYHQGFSLTIPKPEAYVLQKMIINHKRGDKAPIDRVKINNLLPFLNKEDFNNIYHQLFKKEQKRVDVYIEQYCPQFSLKPKHLGYIDSVLSEQSADINNPSSIEKIEELLRIVEVSEMQFKTIDNQFNDALIKKYKSQKKELSELTRSYIDEQLQKGANKEKIIEELKELFSNSNIRYEEYTISTNKPIFKKQ